MKYLIFISLITVGCSVKKDENLGKPDNYVVYETEKTDDCSIYQMIFKNGDYLFRFALSGACKEINQEKYLENYDRFLNENDSILKKKGKLLFEFYNISNESDELLTEIIEATKLKFKTYVTIEKISEDRFTLRVFDKEN
ncbi:MAG: hypothetical protein ACSHXL_06300 [Bacteroidota bacterium]